MPIIVTLYGSEIINHKAIEDNDIIKHFYFLKDGRVFIRKNRENDSYSQENIYYEEIIDPIEKLELSQYLFY